MGTGEAHFFLSIFEIWSVFYVYQKTSLYDYDIKQ